MSESIILKKNPVIEFQLGDDGCNIIDGQTESNSVFFTYRDLESVELNYVWFPKLAKWLRAITWVLNGVPYFPDAESYKKAKLTINLKQKKLSIWLTDTYMAGKASRLVQMLNLRAELNTV